MIVFVASQQFKVDIANWAHGLVQLKVISFIEATDAVDPEPEIPFNLINFALFLFEHLIPCVL